MPRPRYYGNPDRSGYLPPDIYDRSIGYGGYEEEYRPRSYRVYEEEDPDFYEEDSEEEFDPFSEEEIREIYGGSRDIVPYKKPYEHREYNFDFSQYEPYVKKARDLYNYENEGYMTDSKGRPLYYDYLPNMFDPSAKAERYQTLNRVPKTLLNEFAYGTLGSRHNVRSGPEPLTIMPFDYIPEEEQERMLKESQQARKEKANEKKAHDEARKRERQRQDESMDLRRKKELVKNAEFFDEKLTGGKGKGKGPPTYGSENHNFVAISSKNPGQFKQVSGVIEYSNREFIEQLNSTTSSNLPQQTWTGLTDGMYKIIGNAGLSVSFGSLSQIVSCFQFYRFKKIKFIYIPVSGDSLADMNTQLGQVIFCINYNVGLPDPISTYQMIQQQDSMVIKPSQKMTFEVDCSRMLDWYYTRIDANTTTGSYLATTNPTSIQMTDAFNFYIACVSSQNANTVGQLFVEYTVCMRASVLQSSLLGSTILYWRAVCATTENSPNTNGNLFQEYSHHGSLGCSFTNTGGYSGSLKFPTIISTGVYRITLIIGTDYSGDANNYNVGFSLVLAGCTVVPSLNLGYGSPLTDLPYYPDCYSLQANGVDYELHSYNVGPYNTSIQIDSSGDDGQFATFVVYISINTSTATVNFVPSGFSGVSRVFGGSITVEQCNPDLQNSMNSYGYIVNG